MTNNNPAFSVPHSERLNAKHLLVDLDGSEVEVGVAESAGVVVDVVNARAGASRLTVDAAGPVTA